jgi:NADPH:quinone reductase-like Zn-dependent oxidoreductase
MERELHTKNSTARISVCSHIRMKAVQLHGQTILVTGAAGNVGRTALSVARHHGAKAIGITFPFTISRQL